MQEFIVRQNNKDDSRWKSIKIWAKLNWLSLGCYLATFYFASNFYIENLKIIVKYIINIF